MCSRAPATTTNPAALPRPRRGIRHCHQGLVDLFDTLVVCGLAFESHVNEEGLAIWATAVPTARMNAHLHVAAVLKPIRADNLFVVFGRNFKFCDEFLNGEIFYGLSVAKIVIESLAPSPQHSTLGYKSPFSEAMQWPASQAGPASSAKRALAPRSLMDWVQDLLIWIETRFMVADSRL